MLESLWRIWSLFHCWWECKMVKTLWKTVWRYLRQLRIELLHDPAITLLGIYLDKTFIEKNTCALIFIATLYTTAKIWEQHECPLTDEWIKKMWYICPMEYYSSIKEQINAICSNMDTPRNFHTKWNMSGKDKCYISRIIYDKNEPNYRKKRILRNMENKLLTGGGRKCGLGCKFGVSRGKLLHLEWIKNDVLHSAGNYMSHFWCNFMRDNVRKKYICICMIGSLCAEEIDRLL